MKKFHTELWRKISADQRWVYLQIYKVVRARLKFNVSWTFEKAFAAKFFNPLCYLFSAAEIQREPRTAPPPRKAHFLFLFIESEIVFIFWFLPCLKSIFNEILCNHHVPPSCIYFILYINETSYYSINWWRENHTH